MSWLTRPTTFQHFFFFAQLWTKTFIILIYALRAENKPSFRGILNNYEGTTLLIMSAFLRF